MGNKDSIIIPDPLLGIEGFVRQLMELDIISGRLNDVMSVGSDRETCIHADIRHSYEREIQARRDYLSELIARRVVDLFRQYGIEEKYPELQTTRTAPPGCIR